MKNAIHFLLGLYLLSMATTAHAQFIYATNNGAITITGYTGPGGSVTIPSNINDLTVTSIGTNAFALSTTINSVTIPNTVTNIGDNAFFAVYPLINVTIGNGVLSIGNGAFNNCFSLEIGSLGNSVVSIGDNAFSFCNFNSITIPNSVASIGDGAFAFTRLTGATIPSGVTNLGGNPFAGCSGVTSIGVAANNPAYTNVGGLVFNKSLSALIAYPAGKAGSSYTVSDNILSIGTNAFNGCGNLTNVMIPASVTSIGGAPFGNCNNLTAINVDTNSPAYISLAGILFNYTRTALIEYPEGKTGAAFAIPASVTSIGDSAFAGAPLAGVTIPNGVISIGNYSFEGCGSLTRIIIPATVTNIGSYAFYFDGLLTGLYFEGNAPSVGESWAGAPTTNYYLPGTTGWTSPFNGIPTALWTPTMLTKDGFFGVQNNQFGFNISWASNQSVTVRASPSMVNPVWTSLTNITLTNGSFYFSDANWANYPGRYYRVSYP